MPPKLSAAASALVARDADPAAAANAPFRAAGRAARKRLRVEEAHLLGVQGIDSQDVGIVLEESTRLSLVASGVPGNAPPWAAGILLRMDGLQQAVQNVQQTLQNVQQTVQNVQQNMAAGFVNIEARMANGLADIDDLLVPLVAQGGGAPANFPQTRGAIAALTGPTLAVLLRAYGLAVPHGLRARRRAFARHIGVRMN